MKQNRASKLNILILYDMNSMFASAVAEHLNAFKRYSNNNVFFMNAVGVDSCEVEFDAFDAVIIHYSIRLSLKDHISKSISRRLSSASVLKILFIQDEYDTTETARRWIEELNINVVYTCISPEFRESVYPTSRFPSVEFRQNLTGYVPDRFLDFDRKRVQDRHIDVGYRGRALHPVYGRLGWEKQYIGTEFKSRSKDKELVVDIEWDESKRIYGDAWINFLSSCRAFLGTESGANIFDIDGSLRIEVDRRLAENPGWTLHELEQDVLRGHEAAIAKTNQISPKMFEAIALGTALVLFEGTYSGILAPDIHFIELKKDFSNFDEVICKVKDEKYLADLTTRAYNDIVLSGRYSYSGFVSEVDKMILSSCANRPKKAYPLTAGILSTSHILNPMLLVDLGKTPLTEPHGNSFFQFDVSNASAYQLSKVDFVKFLGELSPEQLAKLVLKIYFAKIVRVLKRTKAQKIYHYFPSPIKDALRPILKSFL